MFIWQTVFCVRKTQQLAMNFGRQVDLLKKKCRALSFSKGQHLIFGGDLRVSKGYLPRRKYSYFKKVVDTMLYQVPIFHSSYSSKGQVASTITTWTVQLSGFEMANMDHLEVMARLTCQALRVFGGVGFAWCVNVVPKNGHGEIWIWCVVLLMEEIPYNRLLDETRKIMGWTTNINWLAGFLPSTVWVICFKLLWIIFLYWFCFDNLRVISG